MKDKVMFMIQGRSMGSSSRGPMSGGRILSVEDLLDVNYYKKVTGGNYVLYYQKGRSYTDNITSMRLEEFLEIFSLEDIQGGKLNHLLGLDGGTCVFRKEINEKFGILAVEKENKKNEPKVRCTKKYSSGSLIKDKAGNLWAYLGEFENFSISLNNRERVISGGHVYIPLKETEFLSESFSGMESNTLFNYLNYIQIYSGWGKFRRNNILVTKKSVVVDSVCEGYFTVEKEGTSEKVVKNNSVYDRSKLFTVNWKLCKG